MIIIRDGIERATSLDKSKQGILFQGKNLLSSSIAIGDSELEDLGLSDGSVLNVVPKKKKSNKSSSVSSKGSAASAAASLVKGSGAGTGESNEDGKNDMSEQMSKMEDMLKAQGIDPEELKKLMPEDGKMPDPGDAMKMMQDMMSSPMFDQYMNDENRLEESRQQILNNPLMKQAMQNIPGFSEILNSKEMWRETMRAAAQMYKNMGPDELAAMMNMPGIGGMGAGMPGIGGMGAGMPGMGGMGASMPDLNDLFGSSNSPESNSALDDLSEGDD